MADGIVERVGKKGTSFQAFVYVGAGKRKTKTFATEKQAIRWRAGIITDLAKGARTPHVNTTTVKQAGETLIREMDHGVARTRSGSKYKPSVVRGYEDSLKLHVYDSLGGARLQDVQRRDVQALADRMLAAGASASKVRNAIMPLRVIYRRALQQEVVERNPCEGVSLPTVEQGEIRIASPEEARTLIAALPERDRPLWSTAFYAGLRLGELRGLEWDDVDFKARVIHVRRGWDDSEGEIDPKSRAGKRSVPIIGALYDVLGTHAVVYTTPVVFPSNTGGRFAIGRTNERAKRAWRSTYQCGCEWDAPSSPPEVCPEHGKPSLEPIGLHEARHTFASTAIAAGCNVKELSTYMGHSTITVTLDLYGHLFPGGDVDFRRRMDAHLSTAQTTANRGKQHA